jgi:ketosteroid isomerase-like protein
VNHAESIEKPKPPEPQKPPVKAPNIRPILDSPLSVKAVEQMTEVKPSSPVATKEEVKRFFANYIERYNQRDIHGFLSLFASKAIHNQKDGLEGIRRIYGNFFSQSQILQYRLEDLKMEIYQNTVEAKARYQIDQTSKDEGEKKVWQGRIQWLLAREEGYLKIISVDYQNEKSP